MDSKHYWQTPYVQWSDEVPTGWGLLLCYIRTSRQKARVAAVVEALRLLHGLSAIALVGGPFADKKGLFWIAIPMDDVQSSLLRLPWLGYTSEVDLAIPLSRVDDLPVDGVRRIRWRRKTYQLDRVYQESPSRILEESPDRRTFLLEKDGKPVSIQGYRGDGRELSRRGLPVADARMLVNLVMDDGPVRFLDPFAGVGGTVIEAVKRGWSATSTDIDPVLRFGLDAIGGRHCVADASHLPFADGTFGAIATEPPYHADSRSFLQDAFQEMHRVLAPGGRVAVLCADWQSALFRHAAGNSDLHTILDLPINRKGLDVTVLAWERKLQ